MHKQTHLLTEEENLLRTTWVTVFSGLVAGPIWGFSVNINIVTLLRDQRLTWQLLSLRDIFPQPLSQHRVDLDSDPYPACCPG